MTRITRIGERRLCPRKMRKNAKWNGRLTQREHDGLAWSRYMAVLYSSGGVWQKTACLSCTPWTRFTEPSSRSGGMQSVLRLNTFNQQHPFWNFLWEITEPKVVNDVIPALEKRKEVIKRRLERVRPPELVGLEEAAKPVIEKRLERDLRDIESSLDKLKKYTKKDFISELERQIASAMYVCRNFLPIGVVRDEKYDQKGAFNNLEEFNTISYELTALAGLVVFAASSLRAVFESIIYIGPLRDYPERHYIFSGNLAKHVGKSGKMVPDVLFKSDDLVKQVNLQLESFGLG